MQKKIVLILVLFALCYTSLLAQDKGLVADTMQYLRNEVEKKSSHYIRKSFNVLLKELKLNIESEMPYFTNFANEGRGYSDTLQGEGLLLLFCQACSGVAFSLTPKKKQPHIRVAFEKPFFVLRKQLTKDYWETSKWNGFKYSVVKDCIVSKIFVGDSL